MSVAKRPLALILALCACWVSGGTIDSAARVATDDSVIEADNWAFGHREQCLSHLFGDMSQWIRRDAAYDMIVAIRIFGDQTLDTQVVIWAWRSTLTHVEAKIARGRPILRQLAELHLKRPESTETDIYDRIEIERKAPSVSELRAILSMVDEFRRLEIKVVTGPRMVTHGNTYEIEVREWGGGKAFFSIDDVPTNDKRGVVHPLRRWSDKILNTLRIDPLVLDSAQTGT